MKTALLFAGQGIQRAGMLHRLSDMGGGAELLAEASALLGCDACELDTPERLAGTWGTQLCVFLWEQVLAARLSARGFRPDFVLGQSVGAFSAAVSCGALEFADALRLVDLRGRTMQSLSAASCGMLAVGGLSLPLAERFAGVHGAYVAGINAPDRIVLSGTREALDSTLSEMRQHYAVRAAWLRVAAASHCALMEPVREVLLDATETLLFLPPRIPYLANATGRCVKTAQAVREDLVNSVSRAVRLYDCLTLLHEMGVRQYWEVSPAPVLCRMGRELFPESRWDCIAKGR